MNRKSAAIPSQPPPGTRDFLPEEARSMDRVSNVLLEEFSRWGYDKVVTPSMDYLDVFLLSSESSELFKSSGSGTGETLSFRSDFTPQIGRLSSTLMNSLVLPYKFSYCGQVARNSDPVTGRPREIWQAGAELVGPESPEGDAELIIMGIEALKRIGVKNFKVDIGNVEFFRGIVSDIEPAVRKKIEEFILRKDSSGLDIFLKEIAISKEKKEIISSLPFIFGEKSVISKAWKMAGNEVSVEALETLERVISYIKAYRLDKYITIDLGEIRGLNYYSGIIFECFSPHEGYEIFGGGRYNNLIGAFGKKCAGAGFAVNLNMLSGYGKEECSPVRDFMVFNIAGDKKSEAELVMFLRKKGFTVESNFMNYGYAQALEYLKQKNIKTMIYISKEGILLKNVRSGKEKKFKNINDLAKNIAS